MHKDVNSCQLLINEEPLQCLPSLAKLLGIEKAIILQQIHWWSNKLGHEKDGYKWVYNSYRQWHTDNFTWLSESAIQKHILSLEKMGLLVAGNYNTLKIDRTKWYRIDHKMLCDMLKKSTSSTTMQKRHNDGAKSGDHYHRLHT